MHTQKKWRWTAAIVALAVAALAWSHREPAISPLEDKDRYTEYREMLREYIILKDRHYCLEMAKGSAREEHRQYYRMMKPYYNQCAEKLRQRILEKGFDRMEMIEPATFVLNPQRIPELHD